MSALDQLIASDLAALRDDSRRNPVSVDAALETKNAYRDDLPGAEARRDALADDRRRELAMMPLMLSHVFAHRVGRAVVGGLAAALSLLTFAAISERWPLQLLDRELGVFSVSSIENISQAILVTAMGLLTVYVAAVWLASTWFARRMREIIHTTGEPYRDLDALARGPLEVAQSLVRRVDGLALGLFLGGMAGFALTFGYITAITMATEGIPLTYWSYGPLDDNLQYLGLALIATAVLAGALARACQRPHSKLLTAVSARTLLVGSLIVGAVMLQTAWSTLSDVARHGLLVSTELRFLLLAGGACALLGTAAWIVAWWRRRELKTIGD
jgi:hypothetical protein